MSERPLADVELRATPRGILTFEVGIALTLLVLCLLYALLFSEMVIDSLVEQQLLGGHPHSPRFVGHLHNHNAVEWVLLLGPAVVGWVGTLASGWFLARRWAAR